MSLFQSLHALVKKGARVALEVQAAGPDKLEVAVIPVAGDLGAPLIPKVFTASPQELDAQLPFVLQQYVTATTSLMEQLGDIQSQATTAADTAKQAAKAAKPKTISSVAKPIPESAASADPDTATPSLAGNEAPGASLTTEDDGVITLG